jgi:hypothetical protein
MTSFFFTFFKVFLNGCSGLFVTTLPRLLKIQRADKFFFTFFHFFLTPPLSHEFTKGERIFYKRTTDFTDGTDWARSK